jgi:ATP-dependent helicase/nuclease subunit A
MNIALSPRQEAELRQAEASDPAASAWVGASAGSGKTKVLTDRVLRLLLTPGQSPQRILCLTFTKAAAAEMATRLARELGRWVSTPEGALAQRLAALLGRVPSRGDLDLARRLFAQVLELPGGMRISTIHAFCQSLLRAFPLEAGLAPQFGVVEEADAAALLAECREAVLAAPGGQVAALQALAGLVPPEAFATLVRALVGDRQRLAAALRRPGAAEGLGAALARHLGLEEDAQDELMLVRRACAACPDLVAIARLKQASKGDSDRARAERMLEWLAHEHEVRATRWDGWSSIYLTQEGKRRADSGLATKTGLKTAFEQVLAAMRAEADRVLAVEESRRACRLLSATRALIGLGAPVLERYAARKAVRGLLDYDDLILAAQRVLEDPGSAWVLFKLDGGLDHVLLDEAQDSNPAQWGIAAALTEDFFAGRGAERRGAAERIARTVFAVGDIKQAIYGFQGADSAGFATWKAHFARGAAAIGAELRDVRLNVSFRSTAPVLALVDAVFADGPARDGVMPPGEALSHRPDRLGHAGCVELWPMLEAAETEPPPPWAPPEQPTGSEGPDALLAEAVAARIAGWIGASPCPPAAAPSARATSWCWCAAAPAASSRASCAR